MTHEAFANLAVAVDVPPCVCLHSCVRDGAPLTSIVWQGSMDATATSIVIKTAVVHTVTYGMVGGPAYMIFNYPRLFAETELRFIMRSTTDPRVKLGLLFQPVRGAIFGIAFVLLRQPLFSGSGGWLTMWLVLVLLCILSSFGPNTTSIEGMIFTKIPLRIHLVGLPEILVQSFLLSFVVYHWVKTPEMHWLSMTMWTLFIIAMAAPLLGFLKERTPKKDRVAEPGGPAKGSQQVGPETNRTSAPAAPPRSR